MIISFSKKTMLKRLKAHHLADFRINHLFKTVVAKRILFAKVKKAVSKVYTRLFLDIVMAKSWLMKLSIKPLH